MTITVKLFAVAKQLAGRDTLEIELPAQPTVAELRAAITRQFPELADVVRHARFAINSDYAVDQAIIAPAAEIAVIPPVSGG